MVLTGFRHITEAIESWRAAGLYLPCDTAYERRRIQQVWLERYKDTDAALFMQCAKALAAGRHFPRLYDMDEALAEARARLKLQARLANAEASDSPALPPYDKANSKRRIRELIDHLQHRYTIPITPDP